jgi:hypothetical protein
MEVWKDISGYEGKYQVSSVGRVKGVARKRAGGGNVKERILKPAITENGYYFVTLYIDGIAKRKKIHRLVAQTFIDNPDGKPEVNHINGVKTDNRAENLEWATRSENQTHAVRHGLQTGLRRVSQLDTYGNLIREYESLHEAERETKIHYQNIEQCCKGKYKTAGGYHWQYVE